MNPIILAYMVMNFTTQLQMNSILDKDTNSIRIAKNNLVLELSRKTGKGTIQKITSAFIQSEKAIQIKGIYGLIQLRNKSYLLCVQSSDYQGKIEEKGVYQVKNMAIVPFMGYDENKNDLEDKNDIVDFFKIPGLYYSDYPIYKNYTELNNKVDEFLFNSELLKNLQAIVQDNDLSHFSLYCMQGFFKAIDYDTFSIYLISRRSWKRVGLRYLQRGADKDGNTANFVETEVQCCKNGEPNCVNSYVQIRGSAPLSWKQKIALKWNPDATWVDSTYIVKESEKITKMYGRVFYLNLISAKNHEKSFNDAYKGELNRLGLEHYNYDFKTEGFATDKTKRNIFLENISEIIDTHDFTSYKEGLKRKQKVVVRTNCIDCLDRTNIMQFFIAEKVLRNQLEDLELNTYNECISSFKNAFISNGNNLSKQYAGTDSLQSQVILDEEITLKGKLTDGMNSLSRYFKNRYTHGQLQDGCNLITNNFKKMERVQRFRISNILFFGILLLLLFVINIMARIKLVKTISYVTITTTSLIGFGFFYYIFADYFLNFPRYVDK